MNNIQKIRYAIYNNPLLIGTLLKDTSIKKGIIYSEMKKVLPCKIGIEFELSGDFVSGFRKKYYNISKPEETTLKRKRRRLPFDRSLILSDDCIKVCKQIAMFYNVYEVKIDEYRNDDCLTEVRVCLKDFHQLKGLYLIMQDMNEFCKLHQNGGIHIHVDMSMFNLRSYKLAEVEDYITKRLSEVGSIFPKYTGTYNKRKVGIRQKGTWLNVSRLNTFEYRIAPLTFDYTTLLKWIKGCITFRNKVIHQCKLKLDYPPSEVKSFDSYIVEAGDISDYVNVSTISYSTNNQGTSTNHWNSINL